MATSQAPAGSRGGIRVSSEGRPIKRALALSILTLVIAACGGTASDPGTGNDRVAGSRPSIIPVVASSELAVGPNRFLFTLADLENRRVAALDVTVALTFHHLDADPDRILFRADSRFLWAIEGERGLYASDVVFPDAGQWATGFKTTLPDGRVEVARVSYEVHETTSTPAIGAPAPSIETPTSADVDGELSRISTDPKPLPRLYEVSIADALGRGEPFVVVFATPAFCVSQTCGPTLDTVKGVARQLPDFRFIHVEPYLLEMRDDALQPVLDENGQLRPALWSEAWGLVTEPFVVVIAGDGTVRAKFEGSIASGELRDAIEAL